MGWAEVNINKEGGVRKILVHLILAHLNIRRGRGEYKEGANIGAILGSSEYQVGVCGDNIGAFNIGAFKYFNI